MFVFACGWTIYPMLWIFHRKLFTLNLNNTYSFWGILRTFFKMWMLIHRKTNKNYYCLNFAEKCQKTIERLIRIRRNIKTSGHWFDVQNIILICLLQCIPYTSNWINFHINFVLQVIWNKKINLLFNLKFVKKLEFNTKKNIFLRNRFALT